MDHNPNHDQANAYPSRLGKPGTAITPFGYEWKEGSLVRHPQRAAIRTLAYDLFLAYPDLRVVARLLNLKGYRTRDGKRWTDRTVTIILKETSAMGVYRVRRLRRTLRKGGTPKLQRDWAIVNCEPLVSRDTWNAVNRLLRGRKKRDV